MSVFDESTSLAGLPTDQAVSEEKSGWVFVYPGQGSQFIGMGKDFYDTSESFREMFDRAESISGKKLSKLCFSGPISKLSNTDNLQVATTVVNLAITHELFEKTDIRPDVVLGHSVGEYSALHTAGVISFDDAVKATTLRGGLMQREAKAKKGGMLAIKNMSPEDLNQLIEHHFDKNQVVIANDNALSQQVVSANKEDVSKLSSILSDAGVQYVKLPVSGAWHSPLMAGCVEEFAHELAEIQFNVPKIPVVTNLQAQPVEDTTVIRDGLVSHVVEMVRWRESIEYLLAQGYRNFLEVGPKKVLSRLISSINDDRYALNIQNVEAIADIEKVS